MSFKLGKTNFIGIQFTDAQGNKKLVKPCKKVKKNVEEYLDNRNKVNFHIEDD